MLGDNRGFDMELMNVNSVEVVDECIAVCRRVISIVKRERNNTGICVTT